MTNPFEEGRRNLLRRGGRVSPEDEGVIINNLAAELEAQQRMIEAVEIKQRKVMLMLCAMLCGMLYLVILLHLHKNENK